MPPKRIKRNQPQKYQESIDDEDIISDMPRNVIDCILGKMPIRDAIRTSVLSKKWRLNYLTIPQLVFDDQFCKELVDFAKKKKTRIFYNYQFNEIVTNSLMLHPGRIERFKVCIPKFSTLGYPNVNKWMLYLSTKNIKKLTLEYKKNFVRHKLPPYFFSCLDLTYLKLRNFHFSPPPEFNGFLYLEKLVFFGVHFANNCFESILSGCPILQNLHLCGCSGVCHFNIIGSKLKILCIKADDKFESISLENAPNLTEVTVALERAVIGLEDSPISNLVKFGDCLAKVKILRLYGKFLQFLAETPVLHMLSTSLDSLKIIELKAINFMDFDQISVVVCLIKSAQNLQELYIEASTVTLNQEQVSGYLKLMDCTTLPLSKLHLVKLTKISGFDPEIEFIRFLLFSSPSLVTMSVMEHPELEAEEALDTARKLLQLRPPTAVHIDFLKES